MQARINNLRKRLSLVGADAMLVTSPSNMRYLTGIDNPDGCILITEKGAYAFQDFRYTEAAEKALSGIYEVIDPKGQLYKHVSAILKNDRARSLAYENLFI